MGKINVRGWFNLKPDVAQLVYGNARIGKCNEFVEEAVIAYVRIQKDKTEKADRKRYERHYKAALLKRNGDGRWAKTEKHDPV